MRHPLKMDNLICACLSNSRKLLFTTDSWLRWNFHLFHFFSYAICIRQEDGYCCNQYIPCGNDPATSWQLDNDAGTTTILDSGCTLDYLGVDGLTQTCSETAGQILHSRLCGTVFSASQTNADAAISVCGNYRFNQNKPSGA